jgi:hypothetical protein
MGQNDNKADKNGDGNVYCSVDGLNWELVYDSPDMKLCAFGYYSVEDALYFSGGSHWNGPFGTIYKLTLDQSPIDFSSDRYTFQTLSKTTVSTTWTPTKPGYYNISVLIDDSVPNEPNTDNNYAWKEFYVNAPVTVSPIPNVTFKEDEPLLNAFNLNNYFDDFDDKLTFSFSNNTDIFPIIAENGLVQFYTTENWFGTEFIIFRADDQHNSFNTIGVNVTVESVNDAPEFFHPLIDQYAVEDEYFYWSLGGCIFDVDNATDDLTVRTNSSYQDGVIKKHVLRFKYTDELDFKMYVYSYQMVSWRPMLRSVYG